MRPRRYEAKCRNWGVPSCRIAWITRYEDAMTKLLTWNLAHCLCWVSVTYSCAFRGCGWTSWKCWKAWKRSPIALWSTQRYPDCATWTSCPTYELYTAATRCTSGSLLSVQQVYVIVSYYQRDIFPQVTTTDNLRLLFAMAVKLCTVWGGFFEYLF